MKNIKGAVKQAYRRSFGKFSHLKVGTDLRHQWYGNDYGGFYVYPDLLNQNAIVYSFGIGEDVSFDLDILSKHNCTVYGFDPTPNSVKWVTNQNLPDAFNFYEYGIAKKTGPVRFNLPKNDNYVSGSIIDHDVVSIENSVIVPMKSFKDLSDSLGHKKIDLLKMDIEGSEYDVMEDILSSNIEINQMAIEFHERFFREGKKKTKKILSMMKRKGYEIFEVSFIKKSLIN